MKKTFSLVILISLLLTSFVSCKNTNDDILDDDNINISEYTIVRPDNADRDFINYISTFKDLILSYTDADLPVKTDYLEEGEVPNENAKEILIGNTARTDSQNAVSELSGKANNAYIIKAHENKIVIVGNTDDATIRAMKIFLMEYAKPSEEANAINMKIGDNKTGTVNLDSIVFDNFTEFSLEYQVDLHVPEAKTGLSDHYETLVELNNQPNAENNGTLIASFSYCNVIEGSSGTHNGYKIYKSTDNGTSWEYISTAVDRTNTGLFSILQPCLFELPADVGSFKKGTLFLVGCSTGNNRRGEPVSKITMYYSIDQGNTWKSYCNVAEGGGANEYRGVWEACLMYEESTGRVYCFYSDETLPKVGEKTQKVSYKYTTDMINWSDAKYVASCDNLRPGMISITKMGNGEYFGVYMTGELADAPLYYKTTKNLDDWGDVNSLGTVLKSVDGKMAGLAPWCTWTPAGGECGTLIVVGRHMVGDWNGMSDMFLSFDYGKTFVTIDNPIPYKQLAHGKCGYSAFLGASSDGNTVFYMNNPPYSGTQSKVVFARIKIW